MIKSGRSAGFLLKAAQPVLVIGSGGANYLQRDIARQSVVTGAEHLAHAAVADFLDNPIMPEGFADHRDGAHLCGRMLGFSGAQVNTVALREHDIL